MATAVRPRRRGFLRLIVTVGIVALIAGGGLFWLSTAAQASANANAILSVFSGTASVSSGGGAYAPAPTGTIVKPGDGVKTDAKGRAAIQFPDGTVTRLASGTEITLTSAHFAKDGTLHDATINEKVGRTLSNVQHLSTGSSFNVNTQATSAQVRGTKFEIRVAADGTVLIKLFEGVLDFNGKNHVHMTAPQQATATSDGQISAPGAITPDPSDPFISEIAASDAVNNGNTTPGSEQTYTGSPIHDGEQQQFKYDYAGTGEAAFAVGYPLGAIGIQVTLPDGTKQPANGPAMGNPAVVIVLNGPAGSYTITIFGKSGLGTDGVIPTVAAAAKEPCQSTNIDSDGVVRRAYTEQEMASSVSVSGVSNLTIHVVGESVSGAILNVTASYNGAPITATVVLYTRDGNLGVVAVAVTVLGVGIPADQAMQQVGTALGKDPTSIDVGYQIDRLYSCPGILVIDAHH